MSKISDSKLISDYLAGDESAFGILVERYFRLVYHVAYRYSGNAFDAEDIAQDAFVKVWRNLKSFDGSGDARNWIIQIVKNSAIDLSRKKREIVFSFFSDENGENPIDGLLVDNSPSPAELADKNILSEKMALALENLPADRRQLISLHLKKGLAFREIAELLNEPLNTIKSKYRRAIDFLKKDRNLR